jgi:hypothetical protein
MTARPFGPGFEPSFAASMVCVLALVAGTALPTQAAAATSPSPKVKAALELLQRNPTPKGFRDAVLQARLTKAELQELENAVKTAPFEAAYRSLRTRAEAENFGPAGGSVAPRSLDLRALRLTIGQEHATRLARLQGQAQGGLQAPPAQVASAGSRPVVMSPVQMAALSAARAPSNPSPVQLERTDPEPAITGVVLVILGHNLGRQGEVWIIVGAENPQRENAFQCRVMGWGSEAIHVTVPEAIEDMHRRQAFPNGQRSALVWVKPEGDPSGRWRQITVKLNPDHFVPVITAVHATELTPGLRFSIQGQNLTAGGEPRVIITQSLTNRWQRLRNVNSFSYWLEMMVPEDVGQLRAGPVGLTVNNGLAESRSFVITFTPVEEVAEFTSEYLDACSYSILGLFFGNVPGDCILSGVWGVETRMRPFERITYGDRTATRLANDWTVAGISAEETYHDGHHHGCYFEHAPAAGATEFASTELVGWANGFNGVICKATLVIRGPRGVPISR